jgi:hypothetical protein
MTEGQVRMWNGQGWLWVDETGPVTLPQPWEDMVHQVLRLVADRVLDEAAAVRWLTALVEFAEVTYA